MPLGYKLNKMKNYTINDNYYWKYSTCHSNVTWSSSTIASISAVDLFDEITYQFSELVNKIYVGYFKSNHVSSQTVKYLLNNKSF